MPLGEESSSNPFFALSAQWLETWQRACALNRANLEAMTLFWDPQLRSRWLAELSQALDGYMRSPAFLEWMQYSLKALTAPLSLTCYPPDRRMSDGDNTSHLP
jgi:hypothetical protein